MQGDEGMNGGVPRPADDRALMDLRSISIPLVVTGIGQTNRPIASLENAVLMLTGYSRDDVVGQSCPFLRGPNARPPASAGLGDADRRRVAIELDLRSHPRDGETARNRLLLSPTYDGDGGLNCLYVTPSESKSETGRVARLQADRDLLLAEAEQRSVSLALSEERLRFTQKAGRIGSWTLDVAEMQLVASEGCRNNFGVSHDDTFGYEAWIQAIHTDDRPKLQAAIEASISGQTNCDIEYRIRTPQGATRWIHFLGYASYRPDGMPRVIAGISLDITDRKQVEHHRDLLSKEMTHRVKNTLAIVQSLVRQTLRRSGSLKEAEVALDARIRSLAAAHDVLTQGSWEGATLAEVVTTALRPFTSEHDLRFVISGSPVRLEAKAALAFAMALHELATNAVKYGALSNDSGRVFLMWGLQDGPPPNLLWLHWREAGGPRVVPPRRSGFGSRMIERPLATVLGGTARIDYQPDGIVFTAGASLSEVQTG